VFLLEFRLQAASEGIDGPPEGGTPTPGRGRFSRRFPLQTMSTSYRAERSCTRSVWAGTSPPATFENVDLGFRIRAAGKTAARIETTRKGGPAVGLSFKGAQCLPGTPGALFLVFTVFAISFILLNLSVISIFLGGAASDGTPNSGPPPQPERPSRKATTTPVDTIRLIG